MMPAKAIKTYFILVLDHIPRLTPWKIEAILISIEIERNLITLNGKRND
jgi:hypothetical protein